MLMVLNSALKHVKVIIAGPSGLDKDDMILKPLERQLVAIGDVKVFDVEDKIESLSGNHPLDFLPLNQKALREIWRKAFSNIIQEVQEHVNALRKTRKADLFFSIISLHLTYFVDGEYFAPYDINLLSQNLKSTDESPTFFITVIDDVYDMWKRIISRPYRPTRLMLRELMSWRSAEIAHGDVITSSIDSLNIVMGLKHPIKTFSDLISTGKPLAYLSHPMGPECSKEFQREVEEFRLRLSEYAVVFEPATIDEIFLEELAQQAHEANVQIDKNMNWPVVLSEERQHRWESLYPIEISANELESATEMIRGPEGEERASLVRMQTSSRDFRYIDQSDLLVAYRPTFSGEMHKGMLVEMMHASEQLPIKTVLAYIPKEDPPLSKAVVLRPNVFVYTDIDRLLERVGAIERRVVPSI